MSSSALLLLNVQNNFFEGKSTLPDPESISQAIQRVIRIARASDPPPAIIWVRNNGESGDPDQPNTHGWGLKFPAISPPEHIIDKTRNNVFDREKIDHILPPLPTEPLTQLFVCGMQSEFDLRYACSTALDRGYRVAVIKDAHATFHTEQQRAERIQRNVESELEGAGVKLVPIDQLAF